MNNDFGIKPVDSVEHYCSLGSKIGLTSDEKPWDVLHSTQTSKTVEIPCCLPSDVSIPVSLHVS